MTDTPLFLVGAERSGTTLLRLMLDHHPDIAFNLESEYLVAQVSDSGEFPDPAAFAQWLAGNRIFLHSQFRIPRKGGYVDLVNDFLSQLKARTGKPMVGATVHFGFRRLSFIWPGAKYIYMLRDGRDVAQSVVQMGWAGNAYVAADLWLAAETEWEAFKATLDADQWIEVRYEALVEDAKSELSRICAFMGVAYSDRMFDYAMGSTYSMPDARLSGKWRKCMRPRQVQLVESKIGRRLAARGYPASGYPEIVVGPAAERALRLGSRLWTTAHRIRTFGPSLWIQDALTRRLGLTEWNRVVTKRMDEIVDANLK